MGDGDRPEEQGKGQIGAGEEEMDANFILISRSFFSLAFTKAVGSKRGKRPPRMGWGGVERRGWGHGIMPPPLQSIPPPPTGRAGLAQT